MAAGLRAMSSHSTACSSARCRTEKISLTVEALCVARLALTRDCTSNGDSLSSRTEPMAGVMCLRTIVV